jgi:hypothetical protein
MAFGLDVFWTQGKEDRIAASAVTSKIRDYMDEHT